MPPVRTNLVRKMVDLKSQRVAVVRIKALYVDYQR